MQYKCRERMISMDAPFVRVLGSADWHPTKNNDHSCYTLCDKILIDVCPSAMMALLNQDVDPVSVNTICFTHMHADHYMGLPALLLHWRVRTASLGGLTIIGPKATVRAGVERAMNFVFHDSRDVSAEIAETPKIIEIEGSGVYETEEFNIAAMDADHSVPGLSYSITHKASGKKVGFTGDTRYLPEFETFFGNADMLLHECSFGGGPVDPVANAVCRHASAREAVDVCRKAHVRKLLLTHAFEPKRENALKYAREQLEIPVDWAVPYRVFEV